MKSRDERGAVAVEFAILLPVLLLLVMGIVEFGRAYNSQISLTHAAREAVRVMALSNNPVAARTAAISAAPTLNPRLTPGDIDIAAMCAPGNDAVVTIDYTLETITGIAGPFALTGGGVMRCGG
jgi:Flp pilus assembly protein TadG